MAIVRLQSDIERQKQLYYEFDSSDKPLGEGGMGKVYKGRCIDERSGMSRDVAIKFMFSDLPDHVIERARREASIQLRNDNLVEMLGFIEIAEKDVVGEVKKRYHVVSELLEGVMLDDLLQGKTADHDGNHLLFAEKLYKDYLSNPFAFATTVIRCVLSGVMALHDAGYIHRDIDPTNIMVTKQGHIKLIDFGIAKPINTLTTHDKGLTTAGVFMGKPWYAAPELVLGDVRHQDATTDIYAIGILFYQLYMKSRPFEGANHEVLDMQLHKRMPLKLIPRKDIRAIIEKATNKKQELRYQSAAEFRVDMDKLPVTSINPPSKPIIKWIAGGIAAIAILIVAILYWPSPNPSPMPNPKTEINYSEAVKMLKSPETAPKGISALKSLSEANDYDATYLLSRLYFDPKYQKGEWDNIPDSIFVLKGASNIKPNYQESKKLLEKAVSINPNDCNSLYALGIEYLIGDRKTLEGRNTPESEKYLSKALTNAVNNQERELVQTIERLKNEYKLNLDKEGGK